MACISRSGCSTTDHLWSVSRLVEYELTRKEVTGAWEFGEGEKNRVVKTWFIPSLLYLSDCPLADAHDL